MSEYFYNKNTGFIEPKIKKEVKFEQKEEEEYERQNLRRKVPRKQRVKLYKGDQNLNKQDAIKKVKQYIRQNNEQNLMYEQQLRNPGKSDFARDKIKGYISQNKIQNRNYEKMLAKGVRYPNEQINKSQEYDANKKMQQQYEQFKNRQPSMWASDSGPYDANKKIQPSMWTAGSGLSSNMFRSIPNSQQTMPYPPYINNSQSSFTIFPNNQPTQLGQQLINQNATLATSQIYQPQTQPQNYMQEPQLQQEFGITLGRNPRISTPNLSLLQSVNTQGRPRGVSRGQSQILRRSIQPPEFKNNNDYIKKIQDVYNSLTDGQQELNFEFVADKVAQISQLFPELNIGSGGTILNYSQKELEDIITQFIIRIQKNQLKKKVDITQEERQFLKQKKQDNNWVDKIGAYYDAHQNSLQDYAKLVGDGDHQTTYNLIYQSLNTFGLLQQVIYNQEKEQFEFIYLPNQSGTGGRKLTNFLLKEILNEKVRNEQLHVNYNTLTEYKFLKQVLDQTNHKKKQQKIDKLIRKSIKKQLKPNPKQMANKIFDKLKRDSNLTIKDEDTTQNVQNSYKWLKQEELISKDPGMGKDQCHQAIVFKRLKNKFGDLPVVDANENLEKNDNLIIDKENKLYDKLLYIPKGKGKDRYKNFVESGYIMGREFERQYPKQDYRK